MSAMQFWGVEVKAKESCKVNVEEGTVIHLSQATLGELKKDADPVILYVKVGDKKLVLGILTPGNNPQLAFDLVFDTEFEISHNWKNGSVHVLGYQSDLPEDEDGFPGFSDEDEEEDIPVPTQQNGKPSSAAAKKAEKLIKNSKPKSEEGSEDDSDGIDEEEESDDNSDDAKDMSDMMSLGDDSEEDEDDSDEDDESSDDEEPAKPAESGKKRAKPEAKTPDAKKAKLATPQKTDGKKGGHDATPHPSKKGGKTPGTNKSPKSGAQASCDSCKKTFNSEVALQAHSKAKHGGK